MPRLLAVRDPGGALRLFHTIPQEEPHMAEPVEIKAASNVTDATYLEHYRAIRDASREQQKATALMRLARKRAKGAGIVLADMDAAIRLRNLDADERQSQLRNVARYAAWMGCELGTQADMFGAPEAPKDRVAAEFAEYDATEKGWSHGLHGGKDDGNPFTLGTPFSVAWHKGWTDARDFMQAQGDDGAKKVTGSRRARNNPEDRAAA